MSAHTQTYSGLYLWSLDSDQHARTCGYWYTVTSYGAPHTAFRTREDLLSWLLDRGLTCDFAAIPAAGIHSGQQISGSYRNASHIGAWDNQTMQPIGGYDEFYALDGQQIRVLSNGEWTLGIVTTDDDGIRTVHSLNCNMRWRPIYRDGQRQVREIAA